jgi:hypothetical protein
MLPYIRDGGCRTIVFGVETLNEKAGQLSGKNLGKRKIEEALYKTKKVLGRDTIIHTNFIIGLPGEDEKSVRDSLDWAINSGLTDSFSFRRLGIAGSGPGGPSRFNKDPGKFDLKVGDDAVAGSRWSHEYMTEERAIELHYEFFKEEAAKSALGGWTYISLRNVGFSHEDLFKTKNQIDEIDSLTARYTMARNLYMNNVCGTSVKDLIIR